ncbi:MAG TPA: hypothetical protein VF379_08475 [Gaiellaceae bacterium]
MRLACVLVLAALLAPGAARAGVCSPLNCAASQQTLAHGTLLAFRGTSSGAVRVIDLRNGHTRWRLPGGVTAGKTLIHQDGSLLTWYDQTTGARTGDAVLQEHGHFVLVGASQDGLRAVLARTQYRSTTFAIVSRTSQRDVDLPGSTWSFDALSADKLFLVHHLGSGASYEVRLVRLPLGGLDPRPLKDPGESSTIRGGAWSRVSSDDGRYVYTLYIGSHGNVMVHVLDTRDATARCIDLPGDGDLNAAMTYTIVLDPERRFIWAISPGYGRVAHIDVVAHRIDDTYRFTPGKWNTTSATGVISPDGERIAVTDNYHVWLVQLAQRRVVAGPTHVAIALGWSPDQRHLWAIGERSRVSSLPLR